jgi:hypothetical protein
MASVPTIAYGILAPASLNNDLISSLAIISWKACNEEN